jgi:hypothetical protein
MNYLLHNRLLYSDLTIFDRGENKKETYDLALFIKTMDDEKYPQHGQQ